MAKPHPATQKSLDALRDNARFTLVEKVERLVPRPGQFPIKQDLFGLIDILAIGPGITLGVQATSVGGVSARKRRLRLHPHTPLILEAGWTLEIWGWHKPKNRWELGRVERFELDNNKE